MIASYTLARVHPTRDKEVYRAIKGFNKLRSINGVTATTTLLEANPKQFS
jgi:hypothetical protein